MTCITATCVRGCHTFGKIMRIQRQNSRLNFRSRRREGGMPGCLPLLVVAGLVVGLGMASWHWLGQRMQQGPATNQAQADLQAAQAAFDRGDLDTAVTLARRSWAADPQNGEALMVLARALIYRSYDDYDREIDRDLALQITREGYTRLSDDAAVMAAHAFALQAAGQPVQAAQIAEAALRRDPTVTLARVALALAYGRVGGHGSAMSENRRAADAGDAWQLDALRGLAISLGDLGQYDEAFDAIEQAVALNGRLIVLHFERAYYAIQIGDPGAATASLFRILSLDPDNVKARLRLCTLSSQLRETDTALRYCEEVIDLAPAWADGWYHLGREYFLQGEFAAAQASLNRCSTLQAVQNVPVAQRHFECWYMQGQAAEILGDCDSLLAIYAEFQQMTQAADLAQTWVYPPEGPPICAGRAQP
jgi:tetratricopeptide (TPR) repeat protein